MALEFSLTFLSDKRAFVIDSTTGGAFLDILCSLAVTVAKAAPIEGQAASCWSAYSEKHKRVYVFDGGVPDISVFDAETMEATPTIADDAAAKGKYDAVLSGDALYTLDGSDSITFYSLAGEQADAVQTLYLTDFCPRQPLQGLTLYSPAISRGSLR